MTMITPSYLGETIEYSSLHACRSTLEDPTYVGVVGKRLTGLQDDHRTMADEIVEALEQQVAVGAANDTHADALSHPVHGELNVIQHRLLNRFGVNHEDESLILVDSCAAHPRPGFDHRRAAGIEDEWRMALNGDALERFQPPDERERASHAGRQVMVEVV